MFATEEERLRLRAAIRRGIVQFDWDDYGLDDVSVALDSGSYEWAEDLTDLIRDAVLREVTDV